MAQVGRNEIRQRIHKRIRARVAGTQERPRLAVFRSLKHIYAQVIDDKQGRTLAAASSGEKNSSVVGGNLALLQTGDKVRVDLRNRRVDVLVSDEEMERRRCNLKPVSLTHDSPWQELYRQHVGQLETGACLEFAVGYRDLRNIVPRHSH